MGGAALRSLTLVKLVPSHVKGPVDAACRAVKAAWLFEAKRADLRGEKVSLVRLNDAYMIGKQWYARHLDNPEVCLPLHPRL